MSIWTEKPTRRPSSEEAEEEWWDNVNFQLAVIAAYHRENGTD